MRLYLSSYRASTHEDKLLQFLNGVNKVAVITNAKDYKTAQDRKEKIEDNFNYWRSIGLEPTEVDLRPFFHKPGAEKLLSGYDFVWLAGGNMFLLIRALSYTRLDKFIYEITQQDKIVLGGENAGAIVMGPTLKYSEEDYDEDSPDYIPDGYNKEIIWEGLNLVDYVPVPHYKTPGYVGIDDYVANLEKEGIPHKDITDSQAIIIDGDKEEFLE